MNFMIISVPLLVSLLGINKGKKLIPRIIRPLTHDQNLTMLSVIVANFSQLQICQHVIYPGTQVANAEEAQQQRFVPFEDVELFMNAAAPSLLGFITEAPMQVVIGLTRLFMEKNNIKLVAQTKVKGKKKSNDNNPLLNRNELTLFFYT